MPASRPAAQAAAKPSASCQTAAKPSASCQAAPKPPASCQAAAKPSASWIIGRRSDLALTFGLPFALTAVLFAAALVDLNWFVGAALAFEVVLDYPHVLQTQVRALLDPREHRTYLAKYWGSLCAVTGIVTLLLACGRYAWLVGLWVYWQPFHVIKQHDGVVGIYAAKAGWRGPRRLAKVTLFLGCLAPITYRVVHTGLAFGTYRFAGVTLRFSGVVAPVPPLPVWTPAVLYGALSAAAVALVVQQARAARAGAGLGAAAIGTLCTAVASYNAAYVLLRDLYAIVLVATVTHSLQYHLLCWARNQRRFREGCAGPRERALAFMFRKESVAWCVLGFAALGMGTTAANLVLSGALPIVLVFHHFLLDAWIWKPRLNPALSRDLELPGRWGTAVAS